MSSSLTVFPYDGTDYVDCPRALFGWFLGESNRMFSEYIGSPEAILDYTDIISVMQPYYDTSRGRTSYRKEQKLRFDEESFGYASCSGPDKLDACIDAYHWLRNPDWVTPDRFIVDVTQLDRPAGRVPAGRVPQGDRW